MKVEDLIKRLEYMPKDAPVLVEGVEPDRVILEKTGPGNAYVRIFKSWDVDLVPKYMNPCMACPQHPSNGGSGICHCILGSATVW